MTSRRARQFRRLATGCLKIAQQASDESARLSLLAMAQIWLDLAAIYEHDDWNRRHIIRTAIGDELKAWYRPRYGLPPHFVALLAEMNAS
jgi:hypothetical protein